jgi:hypothetical protein
VGFAGTAEGSDGIAMVVSEIVQHSGAIPTSLLRFHAIV